MGVQQIVNIEMDKLSPHPDNPRKDLGDLTELAESIKVNGILQNLTVTPMEDGNYRVVIGHRRLAAARLVGLMEVPCDIREMTEQEQLATMLLENMQRSDLTVYEQARGFQMMLDSGGNVKDISKKTGLSETTVRHRVKLMELDSDKFQESVQRGGTIQDYIELEKIKSPELKETVLEAIGTANFRNELLKALEEEQGAERIEALVEELSKFASLVEDASGLEYRQWIIASESAKFQKPEDAGERKYFYKLSGHGVYLYTERTEEEIQEDTKEKEAERKLLEKRKERVSRLKEASQRACELRKSFIAEATGLKKKAKIIMEFAVKAIADDMTCSFDDDLFLEMLGIKNENEEPIFDLVSETFEKTPEKVLLAAVYCNLGDDSDNGYSIWNGNHRKNENLDELYDCLEKLGYQMSDEEKALQDGTHELFAGEETEEEKGNGEGNEV